MKRTYEEIHRRVQAAKAKRLKQCEAAKGASGDRKTTATNSETKPTSGKEEKVEKSIEVSWVERMKEIDEEIARSNILAPLPSVDANHYERYDQRSLANYCSTSKDPYKYSRFMDREEMEAYKCMLCQTSWDPYHYRRPMAKNMRKEKNKYVWLRYAT